MNDRHGKRVKKMTPVEAAFVEMRTALQRTVSRIVTDRTDIDDILQDTFLKAVRSEKTTEVRNPKAFLMTVARSVALNDLAKKSRSIVDYVEEAALPEVNNTEPALEDHIAARERYALFCEAVATLPRQCRRAFMLRKVFGYSQKEIAQRMGISVSTVEKHLIAGLSRCSAFMEERTRGVQTGSAKDSQTASVTAVKE